MKTIRSLATVVAAGCLSLSAMIANASAPSAADGLGVDYEPLPQAAAEHAFHAANDSLAGEEAISLASCNTACCGNTTDRWTWFAGIDGSKQPQDFGANANLGAQINTNLTLPLHERLGIGAQLGTGLVATDNAVQVFELVGEATTRWQSYTTAGLFQRRPGRFAWGVAYDFLYEESYDNFALGQWRLAGHLDVTRCDQIGFSVRIADQDDFGQFGTADVRLKAISQGVATWRHFWQTGVQSTVWLGVAEGHSEDNAVTGPARAFDEVLVFGADFLSPLNNHLAIYGETNLMMPADTGTVDAFLGVMFFPGGGARQARRGDFSPIFSVAAPTSFSVDLQQQ